MCVCLSLIVFVVVPTSGVYRLALFSTTSGDEELVEDVAVGVSMHNLVKVILKFIDRRALLM